MNLRLLLTGLAALLIAPVAPAATLAGQAEASTVVDCLLPGAMRRLGSKLTYVAPRKVIKVRALECEIRGGEYVLYDRADPDTALQLWLSSAQLGDADAQNRVGQIYQMGIGGDPDPAEAAKWFRKAADQGHRAAALNLAAAYETGAGVPRDEDQARAYYAIAQGSTRAQTDTTAEALAAANERIRKLEQALQGSQAEREAAEEALREETRRLRSTLDASGSDGAATVRPLLRTAGSAPRIELLDPNFIRTRNAGRVGVRANLAVKDLVGRVRTSDDRVSVTVNDKPVAIDRFGFFTTTIPLGGSGTEISIVAEDGQGGRDIMEFLLAPTEFDDAIQTLDLASIEITGRRIALLIGNNDYQHMPALETAVNDVETVGKLLAEQYGYETQLLINAGYDRIMNALNDLALSLNAQDHLLIYYAGHGVLDTANLRGHWVPVDGDRLRDTRWIPSYRVTDLLNKMSAKKILLVSDSCYSGAFTAAPGTIPTMSPDLSDALRVRAAAELERIPSRTMLTSGFLSPVLDGGGDGHSVFARAFIDVLNENSGPLDGYSLYSAVETRVLRAVKAQQFDQTPVYAAVEHAGHQGGDFILLPQP